MSLLTTLIMENEASKLSKNKNSGLWRCEAQEKLANEIAKDKNNYTWGC